jgi:antitoxin component YwqK of YwqJK toxin-antitoxin module
MTNIGYIPVRNFIVTIDVLDDYNKTIYKSDYDPNNCSYITQNYRVINIFNYTDNKNVSEIEYEFNENFYKIYYKLDANTCYKLIMTTKLKFIIDNIYSNERYYYKNYDVALSKNYMVCELYLNNSGLYKDYHENGYIKEEYYHINGIKQGFNKKYYQSGGLEEVTEYVDGKKHGISKKYNGEVDSIEYYVMGKKHGLCVYYNFGRLGKEYKTEITFNNDIPDGIYRKYHNYKDGGLLKIECNFTDGKYNGIYKEYDMDGTLLIECDYKTYNKKVRLEDID